MKTTAKKKANSPLARLSTRAKVAVIATAILLLAAILFGIVWSLIDHSYRYDRIDLAQYFANGKNPFDYKTLEGLKELSIRLETDLTAAKVEQQISTNLTGISSLDDYKKWGADAVVTPNRPFADTVYMYYEVYKPTTTEGGKDTLLISNTNYVAVPSSGELTEENSRAGAKVVRLGSGSVNAVLEKWIENYYKQGTTVERLFDKDKVVPENYTYVLDVVVKYKTTNSNGEEVEKNYLTLNNYYYQPAAAATADGEDSALSYYKGNETLLGDTTVYDSTVKKADADLVKAINAAAAALTKIGEKAEGTMEAGIDTTSDVYSTTYTVTLKTAFLAEQKVAEIDLADKVLVDEEGNQLVFTYNDANNSNKEEKIESGKLKVRLTIESVLSLDKTTVTELTKDAKGFAVPTVSDSETEDDVYAGAYVLYIKDQKMAEAIATAKKSSSYLSSIRTALWKELVEMYSTEAAIPTLPQDQFDALYKSTMDYHKSIYKSNYSSTRESVEEYILKDVYEDEESTKLSASQQEAKIREYIEADLRESMCEKLILFAIAERRGIEATSKEIREYKELYRQSVYDTYYSYYSALYASSMSAGEIKIQCQDIAKQTANSYEKTYYREAVILNKVQELLVPNSASFNGDIVWTYQGEADSE